MSTDTPNSNPEAEEPVVVKASTTIYMQLASYGVAQIQRHGLVFVLMLLGLMWFYKQHMELTKEVKDCNNAMLQIYQENQTKMEDVINRNTLSWEQLRYTINNKPQ